MKEVANIKEKGFNYVAEMVDFLLNNAVYKIRIIEVFFMTNIVKN